MGRSGEPPISARARAPGIAALSPRQRDVLQLLVRGLTNAEIGGALGISGETVRTHVSAVFRVLHVSNRTEAAAAYLAWDAEPERVAQVLDRPAIAVLPIATIEGDHAAARAGAGIARDLVALFSRWCWFPVIASVSTRDARALGSGRDIGRALGARFLIDGMLRTSAAAWRLTIDLVDADNGRCLSSASYDFPSAGVFDVQDEVCQVVVASSYPQLIASIHAGRTRARAPGSLAAWELAHAGFALQGARERDANRTAREYFTAALAADPTLVLGHYGLGLACWDAVLNQWDARQPALDQLAACAERCAVLAPQMAEGWYLTARHCQARGRHDLAAAPLRDAIGHNPSFATAHALLAQVLLLNGGMDEGLVRMRHACRLGPRAFVGGLAVAHFIRGEYAHALDAADLAITTNPRYPFAHAIAAAAAWLQGDAALADQHARALRTTQPSFEPGKFLETFGDVEAVTRLVASLEAIDARRLRRSS